MKKITLTDATAEKIAELLKNNDSQEARAFLREYNKQKEKDDATKYEPYFYGQRVSDYGLKYGRVDYLTLSRCFDCVLCNNIADDYEIFDNIESGDFREYYNDEGDQITAKQYDDERDDLEAQIDDLEALIDDEADDEKREQLEAKRDELQRKYDNYDERETDIFQYYIVSDNALYLLKEAGEIVLYSEKLDCYIWAITHYGTAWDYVLTSIKLREKEAD